MKRVFSLVLLYSIFTGCIKRPHKITNYHIKSRDKIVNIAKKYLGKPYRYGAIGPNSFDCSGFVYRVTREAGINVPRTAIAQSQIRGKKLSVNELRDGDLLFFDTAKRGHVNHSGIYIGNYRFIHASSGNAHSVTVSNLNGWYRNKFKWGKRVEKSY